jgi:transcriptional antiterminator
MRLDRLLSIVITLLNKDKITADELAKKYEVSVRTVYRDLEALHQAGIPVVAYSGNQAFRVLYYIIEIDLFFTKILIRIVRGYRNNNHALVAAYGRDMM